MKITTILDLPLLIRLVHINYGYPAGKAIKLYYGPGRYRWKTWLLD